MAIKRMKKIIAEGNGTPVIHSALEMFERELNKKNELDGGMVKNNESEE